jgi:parvulin-like peptidyl-prolyl isomerase
MKGGKRLAKRVIYFVLISLLFILNGSAQTIQPEKTAKAEYVVLKDRRDVLQEVSLTKLSAEDVQMIIQEEARNNPMALTALAGDPKQRKKVLDNLREALAVASEAVRKGFADEEPVKIQLELARREILASAYDDKLKADAGKPNDPGPPYNYIEDKVVNAFFADPANKAGYDQELEKFLGYARDVQKKSNVAQETADEQKQFIISQWKKVTYGAVKAKEMDLVDRKTELLYKLQQSILLARAYTQEKLKDQMTPADDEIKAYIAANPKFSKEPQRAKAEEVLAKVKAGGDFTALANEYTEDPGNKDMRTGKSQGGLYDWKSRDSYVKEFSDAAWALEAGQTSDIVETQFGYHIIKLEGKRREKGSGEEQIKVRHILISTMYKGQSDSAMPAVSLEDGAKQELAQQKQKKVLDDIMARNPIDLPADFTVDAPEGYGPGSDKPVSDLIPQSNIDTIRSLPVRVKKYLNLHYKGWKLSPSEKGCGAETNTGVVSGDFNGDSRFDYAVKFTRGKKGYILAFLNLKNGFKPFVLHDTDVAEVKYSSLSVRKKGDSFEYENKSLRLKYDAPADHHCESDIGRIHYYRNGKFVAY